MADWIETYRGSVPVWECDITEHFTIAYYFKRLDEAAPNLAEHLGFRPVLHDGRFVRRLDLRFVRELRAGDAFHITSAPLGLDGDLRLAHRFVDSASGETVTWVAETWEGGAASLPAQRRDAIASHLATWDGPAVEARPQPRDSAGFIPTSRGRVGPGDLDETGGFALAAFVHRFTDCCLQAGAAVGMTAEYMAAHRRAYSTFELALRITKPPRLGEAVAVHTGIVHLGNSSVRFLHRMTDAHTGEELARMGQFGVQLDLDARRPAPLPEELRARAARLVVAVE
ncbi:MAG TPA: thioesterase family protein [Stellaceae bacterium]|nr:thioesterase family protein [Stellaceae bacterium]